MDIKRQISVLGFRSKENAVDVFEKKYPQADGYAIEVNVGQQRIDYGDKIKAESKTTQNFFHPENVVVLDCVNRLLEKGYKPENIILEKTFPLGHNSGRLDILVTREDKTAYLMIECKTIGKEFDKAFNRLKSDGGQLFTYFQQDKSAEVLMLYASEIKENRIDYKNEIVRIEDDYRQTSNVKDIFDRWNKLPVSNGIFEEWVEPYNLQSKALTPNDLNRITQEDSSFIFNNFLEILRHNVVSDKPNAFNKIFTLFLCKIYDEKTTKPNEELKFQWFEGKDNDVSFQIRLTDLYREGMREFLGKDVTDFSEDDFDTEYKGLDKEVKESLLRKINKLRLEKNNEFAIKEVFDEKTFKENAKIVKEVVELLQKFRLRYNKRQQYLSDFFEMLLTTGLKQEAGQFFTPVPIAQFIIKSLPIDKFVNDKLDNGTSNDLLPYLIDYAAGSGHFITESMHEIQRLIDDKKPGDYIEATAKKIKTWQSDPFDWATQYVYGVEKDYRLVKVGKVGCYLHGDGLANVVLSDGLASFDHPEYKLKLKNCDSGFPKENRQFDIVVSNPPYSVSAFKNTAKEYYTNKDFDLYDSLTDSSSEIECLFIERTRQLLKDGGVAGVILPQSILEKGGIYTKAREIILKYFVIVAITEFGSNTFMATGVNTVVLFIKRRNNYDTINLQKSVDRFFDVFQDVTLNKIEKPVGEYIRYVWGNIGFEDYVSLLGNVPNANIKRHEFYKNYRKIVEQKIKLEIIRQKKNRKTVLTAADTKKITERVEKDCWNTFIETEKEKVLYFILAYPQKVVLVKTGEKDEEKRFLGYKFSDRRETQGILPTQIGKTVEQCTGLFDPGCFENFDKASSYIYNAFKGIFDLSISENLKNNVFYCDLIKLFTFTNVKFEMEMSLTFREKVEFKSKWDKKRLGNIFIKIESGKRPKGGVSEYLSGIPSLGGEHIGTNGKINITKMKFVPEAYFLSARQGILEDLDILLCKDGALTGKVALFEKTEFPYSQGMINEHVFALKTQNEISQKFVFYALYSSQGQKILKANVTGTAQGGLNRTNLENIQIPFPPMNVQKNIVAEIELLTEKAKTIVVFDVDEEIERILKKYL
ncbi:MAG: N-6 DNA methylase [Chitinispirillales bacterium]|jgi:type I restriction enzyme M protein|nr:N-6 DNA methylase [Chitinispirillales bacterium]